MRRLVDHSLACPCGGFLTLRHNEISDNSADFHASEVYPDIGIKLNKLIAGSQGLVNWLSKLT